MALSGSGIGQRFEAEVEALIGVIGHAGRAAPRGEYRQGTPMMSILRRTVTEHKPIKPFMA